MLACLLGVGLAAVSPYGVTIEPLSVRWIPNREAWFNLIVSAKPLEGGRMVPKGTWEGQTEPFRAVVELERDGMVVRRKTVEVSPQTLATVGRQTPPDRTIWTHFDPNAVLSFRVAGDVVRSGRYRIDVRDAATSQVLARSDEIVVKPIDWDRLAFPSRIVGKPPAEAAFVPLGNPALAQFPATTADDCQARSVWCLARQDDRVIVGYGDWRRNRGPIDLWSVGRDGKFRHEYTTQENSVDLMRRDGGRLLVPGMDGVRGAYPDGLAFGNLYIREKGWWRKLSTLPQALHVTDVVAWGPDLFVIADAPEAKLFRSADGGLSWKAVHSPMPLALASTTKALITLSQNGFTRTTPTETRFVQRELLPGALTHQPHRVTPFRDTVLYTSAHRWLDVGSAPRPLYTLNPETGEVRVVSIFRDKSVQDISVEGNTVRVLVGSAGEDRFRGEIYESQDLHHWRWAAHFPAPALPVSLAVLGDRLVVGTANRGYSYEGFSDYHLTPYTFADREAGTIGVVPLHAN